MSKTLKIIIFLLTLDLIVFGSCFYLFMSINNMDKEVSLRLNQIESEVKKDESLRSIKNLMNDTKEERERINRLFIQPNGTVDFIETVELLGRTSGVKIEVESVGVSALKNKTASSTTELFNLSFKTEGSWKDTMHLLSLLDNMSYQISFENVNLSKISGKSDLEENKKENESYWNGNFNFTVLKIKNLKETEVKNK